MNNYLRSCLLLFLVFLLYCTCLTQCTKPSTPVGEALFKVTENKVYKEINNDSLKQHLQDYLTKYNKRFKNPNYLRDFYAANDYRPILLTKFYPDSSLFSLIDYLEQLEEHGLSKKNYRLKELKELINRLGDKEIVKSLTAVYDNLVAAELLIAESLTNYSFALQYGQVNPRRILNRYYIPVKRPDSLAFKKVLLTTNLRHHLDSIQPDTRLYKRLQEMLEKSDKTKENKVALIANMERLRWKYTKDSTKMVYVNIPAFQLNVIKDKQLISTMKVVVGKADGHETPMLSSMIHSVQVNPVWHIPTSIATKEILVQAQADRFYLVNHGIDVYYKGEKRENADSINWSVYNKENLPYTFKQKPGNTNSLGLIKFLFKNGSSVYLHDTPVKATFNRSMRAASHGCVRVEQPLNLALAIFGEGEKYDTIKEEMGAADPVARTIKLKPQVQVILDYFTCTEQAGKLLFYQDVYKQDSVLYSALK